MCNLLTHNCLTSFLVPLPTAWPDAGEGRGMAWPSEDPHRLRLAESEPQGCAQLPGGRLAFGRRFSWRISVGHHAAERSQVAGEAPTGSTPSPSPGWPAPDALVSLGASPTHHPSLLWPQVSRSHLHSDSKDYSLPNSGWSPIMVRLYNELMEKTVDGTWTRLPGYCRSWQFLKEGDLARIAKVVPVQTVEDARLFLRITEMERLGFEYVIFHNDSEKKCVCLFQPGPLLEGLPGIIHGGALGTMIDTTLFMTAYCSANAVFTGTMTITFKSPITLGSVVRLEANITGMEGRKVFLSCEAQSSDRTILFAEASAIFFQMK
uniref:Thioesterase domain-containing protein n=1 Tax=Bos taurus TaxID=9913 RepID=E1BA10_BOVIN